MSDIPKDWPATVALPGSVSHGTLRPADLISSFMGVLKYLRPRRNIELAMEYSAWTRDPDGELASEYMTALHEALEECAPPGYYFGAIEGDGSDFGFWETGEDEDEEPADDNGEPESNEVCAARGMIRLFEACQNAEDNPWLAIDLDPESFREAYIAAGEVLSARGL